jgi:YD repeat-containing protein
VSFSGLRSFDIDPGDSINNYAWNFGDNTGVFNGVMPSHTYQTQGTYTVSLTVTDSHSATATANTTASVVGAPASVPPGTTVQGNGAQFISQSLPTTMRAGLSYPVTVTMRNTGTTTWTAAHLYRLGSQNPQDNQTWGRARIFLPGSVAPGANVTFSFIVVAPYGGVEEPPPAQFQWRMVQDGVEWFGDSSTNQTVTINSNYEPWWPGGSDPPGPFSDLFASRIAVEHRTGQSGEDLLSGNFNWGFGLIDLAGRSGLDLNIGLSYNSLAAWTKVVPPFDPHLQPDWQAPTSFTFDADRGFPSVGFRMGFPTIQGKFSNNQTGTDAYLLLMSSGARVELRRVGSSNVYDAVNSSYLELLDGGNGNLLLKTSDGTQMAYWSINNEYRCTEVKDRNGNYLTIKYDPINGLENLGRMTSIIDTLGRTISFNYDSNYRLQSITQLRNGQSHIWVSFGYTDKLIETNFTDTAEGEITLGMLPQVVGLPENQTVSLLSQVGLEDGSKYTFDYTSWGQVYRIRHSAADGHELNSTTYNLPLDNTNPESDCPRFTQRQDTAENWNNNSPVTVTFQRDPGMTWGQVTNAAGTAEQVTYKEYFTTDFADWKRGLVTRAEILTPDSTTPKKTTITDWTQDVTNVAYQLNPRPTATTISDAEGNRRRSTVEYTAFGLPSDVYELGPYGANDWRVLRRTHTDYDLSEAFISRRIIGLVSGKYLFAPDAPNSGSIQTLLAKNTMEYDVGAICVNFCYFIEVIVNAPDPEAPSPGPLATHFDSTYLSVTSGRGLLSRVKQWDATDEMNVQKVHTSSLLYNIYGSVIRNTDPADHVKQFVYDDSFSNDGIADITAPFLTKAYVTQVIDSDFHFSYAKYSYDLGLLTRQQDQKGASQTTAYDFARRVKQLTNTVNGGYSRFVYPSSQTIVNKFTTINDLEHETYSATVFDGAGRTRATAGDFPDPFIGDHFSGQFTLFDVMGQAIQRTNLTEMTHAWAATGEDPGWNSSSQTYDWKGRPLRSTNQDGTYKEASYGGCGCAGGAVVTLTDEGTLVSGNAKKRQQKIYSDVLGRTIKTEILNWDGTGPFGTGSDSTAYSTTINTYNARDQITLVRQYQGTSSSSVYQDSTMTYDGYGRVATKHVPEQQVDGNNSASTDHTTLEYNKDDTVKKVIDARGVSQNLLYNDRHMVTAISYSTPESSNIPMTPAVAIHYDAAGNREWMTDGFGRMDYEYDTLSRLRSETRTITGVGSFPLNYTYNLAGELTGINNSLNTGVGYVYDQTGRVTSVTGSFANTSSYASNIEYRASGALKHLEYGNARSLSITYNSRQQPAAFEVPGVMSKTYEYNADGRRRFSHDLMDARFDRSYSYDHAGRIKEGLSGAEARNEGSSSFRPYKESFLYDTLDHLIERPLNSVWSGGGGSFSPSHQTYENNRNTGWEYDEDGNLIDSVNVQYTIDASGQANRVVSLTMLPFTPDSSVWGISNDLSLSLDGDGAVVKQVDTETMHGSAEGDITTTATTFFVRSSVLGGKVVMENNSETGVRGFVYLGNEVLASQLTVGTFESLKWEHRDPGNASFRLTNGTGAVDSSEKAELDPLGNNAGTADPHTPPSLKKISLYPGFGDTALSGDTQCNVNGILQPCSKQILAAVTRGSLSVDSISGYLPNWETIRVEDPDDTSDTPEDPDNPNNPVTIREHYHYDLVYTGDVTVSVQQLQPQQKTQWKTVDSGGIRAALERMLRTGDCGKFVEDLINKLAARTKNPFISDYVPDLFDAVMAEKGLVRGGLADKNKWSATVDGRIGKDASIHLSSHFSLTHDERAAAASVNYIDAFNVLHELVHHAGKKGYYDDTQVATVLFEMTGTPGFKKKGGTGDHSTYFSKVLAQHCPVLSYAADRGY